MAQDRNNDGAMEQLMLLMNDILEQLTAMSALLKDVLVIVEKTGKEKSVADLKDGTPTLLETVLKEQVKAELATIKKILATIQQKINAPVAAHPIVERLLQPQFLKRFYRFVFILVTTVFGLYFGYRFTVHANDNRRVLQQQQLQYNSVERAWKELYEKADGKGRKRMDSVWRR